MLKTPLYSWFTRTLLSLVISKCLEEFTKFSILFLTRHPFELFSKESSNRWDIEKKCSEYNSKIEALTGYHSCLTDEMHKMLLNIYLATQHDFFHKRIEHISRFWEKEQEVLQKLTNLRELEWLSLRVLH